MSESFIVGACFAYFLALSVIGAILIYDLIRKYKWPTETHRFIAVVLFITSPMVFGLFPLMVAGVYALATIQTSLQKKGK